MHSLGTYSKHKFSSLTGLGFRKSDYSRFKYGSKSVAREFGTSLAEDFWIRYCDMLMSDQIVVASSPYDFIPTATNIMKDYFVKEINYRLMMAGVDRVLQEVKVYRTRSYNEDYGRMTAAERLALIKNDKFHIDAEYLKGKTVLFLDDVKITGGHEIVVQNMLDRANPDCNYMFLYFAELMDKTVHPNIEDALNHAFVSHLFDVNKIIQDDEFVFNTRVVKYILSAPEEEFCNFINYQSRVFRESLLSLSIGNSYHMKSEYITNFKHLLNGSYVQFIKRKKNV